LFREKRYRWLVAGVWFVLREKYCWLVADKPNEQCPYLHPTAQHMLARIGQAVQVLNRSGDHALKGSKPAIAPSSARGSSVDFGGRAYGGGLQLRQPRVRCEQRLRRLHNDGRVVSSGGWRGGERVAAPAASSVLLPHTLASVDQ
jgi:hypothetical protein